ncbi:hypothetical protein [Massilia sp. Leaf139]|uniref:hypothetical protein n=1 Tax=Massilia sp. Leaf139 TaxID=1736272 RepID=UPI0006F37702|nr:hypothetical protein [Massilia sp. Leaf139]KQQ86380.1 hypothetical protein ASF77_20615 [Massilia sp. Leaf139]
MDSLKRQDIEDAEESPAIPSALLDFEAVRPGDVLLTRGDSLMSEGIVTVTGGRFSHAALWLPVSGSDFDPGFGLDGVILAEADGLGVGFTPMVPRAFENPATFSTLLAYALPGNPRAYKLLRHPGIAALPRERLQAASQSLQDAHFSRAYSRLRRLVDASGLPAAALPAARGVMGLIDGLRKTRGEPGSFCSELVALYYAELGLPLFADSRAPANVSPNDLDAGDCLLEEVPDAFADLQQLGAGWRERGSPAPMLDRGGLLSVAIGQKSAAAALGRFADALSEPADAMAQATMTSMRTLQRGLEAALGEAQRQYTAMDDLQGVQRIQGFALQARMLAHLLDAIGAEDARQRGAGLPEHALAQWRLANSELMLHCQTLLGALQHAHLRERLLFAMRLMRAQRRAGGGSILKRRRLARERKSLMRQWLRRRGERGDSARMLHALRTPAVDGAVLDHIEHVVCLTLQAAQAELDDAGIVLI